MQDGNGRTLAYRVDRLERDVDRKADADDLQRIAEEIASVRRIMIGLLVTIVGFSIGALFVVAQLQGQHP